MVFLPKPSQLGSEPHIWLGSGLLHGVLLVLGQMAQQHEFLGGTRSTRNKVACTHMIRITALATSSSTPWPARVFPEPASVMWGATSHLERGAGEQLQAKEELPQLVTEKMQQWLKAIGNLSEIHKVSRWPRLWAVPSE